MGLAAAPGGGCAGSRSCVPAGARLPACAEVRGLPASSSAFLYKVAFVTAAVGEPVPLPSQGQRRSLSWSELPGNTGQTGEDNLKGCAQFGAPWGGFGM